MEPATTITTPVSGKKIFIFTGLGNLLELYDYMLYILLMPFLAKEFFPFLDTKQSVLFGLLTFAFSFLFAPLGSIFWSWYGDRYGRKKMLLNSMTLMAFPSLFIAVLPNYSQIGMAAPVILVLCRIIQSISVSGEIKGAKIFAMEHLGQSKLGITSGFLSCFGAMGVMCAMGVTYLVSNVSMFYGNWRLAFLVGSLLAICGIYIRKKLSETPLFTNQDYKNNKFFLKAIIADYIWEILLVIILGAMLGILSYFLHGFMPAYLVKLGYSQGIALKISLIGLISTAISSLVSGRYIDKFSAKMVMKKNLQACLILIFPCFSFLLSQKMEFVILSIVVLGSLLGMNAATCSVIMYKLFPTEIRCRGVMIFYALGVSIFGGLAPYALTLASHINIIYPSYILFFSFFIIFISHKFLMNKVKNI